MDDWNSAIVYKMATARHQEDIARGAAARRLILLSAPRTVRGRFAALLLAVAALLDPALTSRRWESPAPHASLPAA
jgi:hypothetical protein